MNQLIAHLTATLSEPWVANCIAIVALTPAVPVFFINQLAQAQEAASARFRDINDQYMRFLELAAQHPELQATGNSDTLPRGFPLSKEQEIQRAILFDMLTTIFERVHHAYKGAQSKQRREEYNGWEEVMLHFTERTDYFDWWKDSGGDPMVDDPGASTYAKSFEQAMVARFRGMKGHSRWFVPPHPSQT